MEKYRLVQEHKADESDEYLDHPPAAQTRGTDMDPAVSGGASATTDNFPEVRITQQGKPRNYISYAMNLFVRVKCVLQSPSVIPFCSILMRLGDLVVSLILLLTSHDTEGGRFSHNRSQGHGTRN